MTDSVTYRAMQVGDTAAVSDLLLRTFDTFIAPGYGEQGIETFTRFVQPAALAERLDGGALFLLALLGACVVGIIEMRAHTFDHITLLFVDADYQRRGISRELLRQVIEIARQQQPGLQRITVNSSPYAVEVYRQLGFVPTGPLQARAGLVIMPMSRQLSP